MNTLEHYGWTKQRADELARIDTSLVPARVVADFGTSLTIVTPERVTAELSGKLSHYTDKELVPKVGDWVLARLLDNGPAVVESILPRQSEIARKVTGKQTRKQVIATNVDIAFVLLALDNDFSVERLKRFLFQLSVSHVKPIVVLNKADKVKDTTPYLDAIESLGVMSIVISARDEDASEKIAHHIEPQHTAILLGSSGVGKSTLTNQLLGRETQATAETRASDDTGKHTTVHRELFVLPGGGLLIDTPGIRELQLWGTTDDLDDTFEDVILIAASCKYTSCTHTAENGCAIIAALADGLLDKTRYADYLKTKSELEHVTARRIIKNRGTNKKSAKNIKRQMRDIDSADW